MRADCPNCEATEIVLLADDGRNYPSQGIDTFLTIDGDDVAISVTLSCLSCDWSKSCRFTPDEPAAGDGDN